LLIAFSRPYLTPLITMPILALMNSSHDEGVSLVRNSMLYREFLAEREEILRHKWIESEKVGYDIGFEKALLDWVMRHRGSWRDSRSRHSRLVAGAN
jgi:hypothetical protein